MWTVYNVFFILSEVKDVSKVDIIPDELKCIK